MNSLEINKFIASVLVAVILIVVINMVADKIYVREAPEMPAETVTAAAEQAPELNATQEAAAEPAEAGPSLAERLANASADQGQRVFRRCQTCHSAEKGAGNRVGPNLYGVVGADIAHHTDFSYSSALADAAGNWTPAKLDAFIASPANAVPGNRMPFAGLDNAGERADLIAYLNSQSDSPVDLTAGDQSGD